MSTTRYTGVKLTLNNRTMCASLRMKSMSEESLRIDEMPLSKYTQSVNSLSQHVCSRVVQ